MLIFQYLFTSYIRLLAHSITSVGCNELNIIIMEVQDLSYGYGLSFLAH